MAFRKLCISFMLLVGTTSALAGNSRLGCVGYFASKAVSQPSATTA